MAGWKVYISTKDELESRDRRRTIVRWRTTILGLSWIDDLVKNGRAFDLGGVCYPCRYSIKAAVLRLILSKGLPTYNSPPIVGEGYFLPGKYNSALEINNEMLSGFPDNKGLIIIA